MYPPFSLPPALEDKKKKESHNTLDHNCKACLLCFIYSLTQERYLSGFYYHGTLMSCTSTFIWNSTNKYKRASYSRLDQNWGIKEKLHPPCPLPFPRTFICRNLLTWVGKKRQSVRVAPQVNASSVFHQSMLFSAEPRPFQEVQTFWYPIMHFSVKVWGCFVKYSGWKQMFLKLN